MQNGFLKTKKKTRTRKKIEGDPIESLRKLINYSV